MKATFELQAVTDREMKVEVEISKIEYDFYKKHLFHQYSMEDTCVQHAKTYAVQAVKNIGPDWEMKDYAEACMYHEPLTFTNPAVKQRIKKNGYPEYFFTCYFKVTCW